MGGEARYNPRAQFTGSLKWLCPWCGAVNTCRVDRTSWKIRCKDKHCRRRFGLGLMLHSLANLQQSGRRPLPPCDSTFPVIPLDFWESGKPLHRHILEPEISSETTSDNAREEVHSGSSVKPQKAKKQRSPARKDTILRRLEASIGEELPTTLHHSGDPRAMRLLELLMDPAYSRHSFAKLCERAGVGMVELVDLFRRYKLDLGILKMSKHVPAVLEDTAIDAKASMVCCKRCDGLGYVSGEDEIRNCPACEGTGKLRQPGNPHARQVVFRANGLTATGPHVTVPSTVGEVFDIGPILRDMDRVIATQMEEDRNQHSALATGDRGD